MLRGGFVYEDGLLDDAVRTTALSGPTAGLTLKLPFGKEKESSIDLDYSYRLTDKFSGTHAVGVRIAL